MRPNAGPRPGDPPYREYENELLNLPLRWDAGWYLQIANPNTGYIYDNRGGADIQQNIVFWPAYPLIVRVVALLLGNSKGAFMLAGTVVSLTAFLCALVYVYLLARDDLSDEQSSVALWFLAAYPFAFFYGAIYTESLFLLSAAGAFYHLKHREFVRAGLWGLMVGLTRANGCLLCVPLALMVVSPWLPVVLAPAGEPADRRAERRAELIPALAVAAMPCVGASMYSAFVWSLTGNPFAWVIGHAAWGRRYTGLTALVTDRYNSWRARSLRLRLATAAGSAERDGRRLRARHRMAGRPPLGVAYAVFLLINILMPIADGGLLSAGRFSSVLFPAFHLVGERRAARATGRLDRHVRGEPGLQRGAVLHVATVVLSVRALSRAGPISVLASATRLWPGIAFTTRVHATVDDEPRSRSLR